MSATQVMIFTTWLKSIIQLGSFIVLLAIKTALTRYLDLGLYIGITGWVCDERRGLELQQLIQYIPNDRLLIETDAPFLIPRNIKPKPKLHRNEPAYLPYICQMIASLKQTDAQTIALHTRQNTERLFRLTTRQ